jgi:hypothetical protein
MKITPFVCAALLFGAAPLSAQTALVRHAPTLNGTVEGSVQQMLPEAVTLNGGAVVTLDLFVPGSPSIRQNGQPTYAGTLDGSGANTPTNYQVTVNGSARLRHVVRRTDAVTLPSVATPATPTGTATVTVNTAGQSVSWGTLRNLTLNGGVGQLAVPPGAYGDFTANGGSGFILGVAGSTQPSVYNFQHLTLNGATQVQVVGPVIVNVANGFNANGTLGAAGNAGWLTLNIAAGGLTLNGGATFNGFVLAPSGTVIVGGNSVLVGGVISDRLTVNGGGVLRLQAAQAPNQPPTVTLTGPNDGAAIPFGTAIPFEATAADADGTVSKVEFFVDGVPLATDTTAPFAYAWENAPSGPHTLTARATDNQGAANTSPPRTITVLEVPATLPYLAGFESSEGYVLGPLDGQKGWNASSNTVVTDADFVTGTRSALVPGGAPPLTLSRAFAAHPADSVVFLDYHGLPFAAVSEAASAKFDTTGSSRIAFVNSAGSGRVSVFNGDGSGGGVWQIVPGIVALDGAGIAADWIRLTARLDYGSHKWDFYLNGRLAAYDLGFAQSAQSSLGAFSLTGHTSAPTLLDDFLSAGMNPLFADADRDGMEDAWESTHGLNPALNDRNGDLDGDTITNIQEYFLGTNPSSIDSDNDGLTDAAERSLGSNPIVADTDGDGMPDGWEQSHGLNPLSAGDATSDSDGDGVPSLEEFLQGNNPQDYYNGVLPQVISLVGVDGELGPDDTLQVKVTDSAGQPLANAPVVFIAQSGGHQLAATRTGPASGEVTVRSGSDGIAKAYVRGGSN